MSVMDILGDVGSGLQHAWNGSDKFKGDAAAAAVDSLALIPGADKYVKDGDGAKAGNFVNSFTGADKEKPEDVHSNLGNKIGTVLGAGLGGVAGPAGMAYGAGMGSQAGGWLADLF